MQAGRKQLNRLLCLFFTLLTVAWTPPSAIAAAPPEPVTFEDTRFQGQYTTENLDAIIEEYELYDGWYWSTQRNVMQTYHGQEGKKAWTQTAQELRDPFIYSWGWFGCRWNWDKIDGIPNEYGWGECYGFAQFLGYLLSGERNPHGHWFLYESVLEAKGLKVGDIVRVEYTDEEGAHRHSAMVYSVDGDTVLYLQAAGGSYNRLYTRRGFTGAGLAGTTSLNDISHAPGLMILRAEENADGLTPWGMD